MENKRGKRVREVLNRQLSLIKIDRREQQEIKDSVNDFVKRLASKLKEKHIKADIFIGGSFAKNTLIKKEKHDIDIFLRFDKKISDDKISEQIENLKVIKGYKGRIVKGSRNYLNFQKNNLLFEIIPIIKISEPKEARNVTDLSVFHVRYILDCVKKSKKILDEIIIAKAFAHAAGCYGAESYIKGFSGYGLELLVCYYKNFLNFIGAVTKMKENEKIVLDPKKFYKSKREVLLNLNEAKLESPIVLIDPTQKERNALAALSAETLNKFREYCKDFLKKPSEKFFMIKKLDEKSMQKLVRKKKAEFIKLKARTNRQAGDIAGSKLLKFYRFIIRNLEKKFDIYEKEFEYSEKDFAHYYLVLKSKKEIIVQGPPVSFKIACEHFKKKHKKTYIKEGRIYMKISAKVSFTKFLKNFKTDNRKFMEDMGITELDLVR